MRDGAAFGRAFLDAHQCTREPRYLVRGEVVATTLLVQFRDSQSGALVNASRDSLVRRAFWPEQPLEDVAGPSPMATTICLLLDLSRRTGQARSREAGADALRCAALAAAEDPLAAAGYDLALANWLPSTPFN